MALQDIVAAFNRTHDDTVSRQTLDALEQIYGYMTFNNNKYGILTSWQHALFLRRVETEDRKTLEYHIIQLDRPQPPHHISMLKAWVGMVLLADDNWFYASPTNSTAPPGRNFGLTAWNERLRAIAEAQEYHMEPVNGKYECLNLNFCLCRFDLSSARGNGTSGCVVNTRLLGPVINFDRQVVCKVVDALHDPSSIPMQQFHRMMKPAPMQH